MKKKIFAVFALLVFSFSLANTALAAIVDESTATQVVGALGIINGDESGNLNLGSDVTRAEFAKMLVAASTYKDSVSAVANSSPFKDVTYSHWAAGYVKTAVQQGWLTGYLDGNYRPNQTITLEEAATGALKILGYGTADFSGSYPYAQIALYKSVGLDEGITASQGQNMSRRNMMYLFYNLMDAKTKEGKVYATNLGYSVGSDGKLDYVALISESLKGPYIVSGTLADLGISTANSTVYRNGNLSTASSIKKYDVIYYTQGLNTLWVYDDAVSGTCQAILPSTSAPTSVTVAGNSYTLSSADAKTAFSILGTLRTGDVVTLLLGSDKTVVGAVKAQDYQAAVSNTTGNSVAAYGIIVAASQGSYTDSSGNSYTSPNVTVVTTDGSTYTYPVASTASYPEGNLVEISTSSGVTALKTITTKSTSGTVSEDGSKLGSLKFADNVQIVDVYGTSALRVYPSRLSGSTISSDSVKYYATNSLGEITHLILKDYTGDMHQYGMLLDVEEAGVSGTYEYDLIGKNSTLRTSSVAYNVDEGAAQFKYKDNAINDINNLTKVELTSVQGLVAYNGNKQYLLGDGVAVYELKKGVYSYSSLSRIVGGNYTITGYYDKESKNGGRIRVLIAEAK